MPVKPPLFRQEKEYSCVPACLRMVLGSYGILKSEEELRELCDCTSEGTDALKLVDAARKLGFANTRKWNLSIAELSETLNRNLYPIVYLRVRLSQNIPFQKHAVVVVEFTSSEVHILDPLRGEMTVQREDFFSQWRMMNGLTILVE